MRCPDCDDELRPAAREEVELAYCPACRGAWLESEELDRLMDRFGDAWGWAETAVAPEDSPSDWPAGVQFYDFG